MPKVESKLSTFRASSVLIQWPRSLGSITIPSRSHTKVNIIQSCFHFSTSLVVGKMNNVNTYITDVENMSTLSLKFKNIEDLKRRIEYNQWRYTCSASNQLGSVMNTFEIKAGRKPHSPQILSIDYKEG